MRLLIRYFFRGVRILLAPVMLISEKLSTPSAVERSSEEQARVDAECANAVRADAAEAAEGDVDVRQLPLIGARLCMGEHR